MMRKTFLASRYHRGFTLLEMLAVMLIIVVGLSVLAASINHGLSTSKDRQAGRDLTLALRTARSLAISREQTTFVHLDVVNKRFQVSGNAMHFLPADMNIRVTTAADAMSSEAVFVFYSDGASSGGNVYLERNGREWRIDVNWLTGIAEWRELSSL